MKRLMLAPALLVLAGCGGHARSVEVPQVNGRFADVALQRLHSAGLRASFPAGRMPCGYVELPGVEHQVPRGGSRVAAGSTVSFVFGHPPIPSPVVGSDRPRWAVVPDLVGKTQKGVAAVLPASIWACVNVAGAASSDASSLVVARQDPAPGTRVRAYGVLVQPHTFRLTTVQLFFAPGS